MPDLENHGTRPCDMVVRVEKFLLGWAPLLLVLTAVVYYGMYYRSGLNLGGEGGTNAVLALRLMEGQRPIADTFLGYNLLWFYPLIAIFKVTGPDYVAMRVFFFVLCTINGLLGYGIVRTITSQAWLGMVTGVLLILIPGMIFRNYMGLIGVLPTLLILKAYVLPAGSESRQIAWMAAVGAGLALCFLLRIEPSLMLVVVWLGLALLYPFGPRQAFGSRLRNSLIGTLCGGLLLLTIHVGFFLHAHQRGFGPQFVSQYSSFVSLFRYELSKEVERIKKPEAKNPPPATVPPAAPSPQVQTSAAPNDPEQAKAATEDIRDARLRRPPVTKIWQAPRPRERFLGLCLYYPIFWSSAFVSIAAFMLLVSIWRGDEKNKERALVVLAATGCALSLLPQYFFFRPDAPHLSEFMVPFLPAVVCSAYVIRQASLASGRRLWKTGAWVLVVFSALLAPLYLKAIMPREEAGTIFGLEEPTEFRALNGVRVKLSSKDALVMAGLRDAVLSHSSPGEYVLCYPYAPTINFMTDRPSYEYNLYIDDSTAGSGFQSGAIERIDKNRPAVIVIDNRPINGTERSRFKNWATAIMAHIKTNYRHAGTFQIGRREVDVYARPDKVMP
ncbi:MAG: hypothetical protein WCI38_11130 [Chthoniobacterales bacterium]